MRWDSPAGYGPRPNADVVIFGRVAPRLKVQFAHASELDRVAHIFGFADSEHAPAFVIHRVGVVDLERHRVSHGTKEFRAARRAKDDGPVVHDVVHGEDERLTTDNDGDPTDVKVGQESVALGALEDLEPSPGFDMACVHASTVARNVL